MREGVLFCKLEFVGLFVFVYLDYFVSLRDRGSTVYMPPCVGLRRGTFQRRKVPKVLQGDTPWYPRFKRSKFQFCFRHEGIEWANHRPRSPAPAAVRMSICLFFGVPCFGGVIHHCTILPIYESGSGKLILQCMAARAGRRSRKSRIMVGETTDDTSLLLMIRTSQRQKREVRNRRGFGSALVTLPLRAK